MTLPRDPRPRPCRPVCRFPRPLDPAHAAWLSLGAWILAAAPLFAQSPQPFRRGDADASGGMNITDAVFTFTHLFLGGTPPPCDDAADVDDVGGILITDGVYLLNYLFLGGSAPPVPFSECGIDPTDDDGLGCGTFAPCAPPPSEFDQLKAAFGNLDTLAGRGQGQIEGANEWEPGFEGGPARDAELSAPHIALGDDAGNIYIADKEAHAIRKVTPDGRIVTVAGTNEPGDDGDEPGPGTERRLFNPNGLWVRGDGTVYILDTDNGKVRRLDPAGILTTLISFSGPIPTGRGLWVADDESLAFICARSILFSWRPGATPEEGLDVHVPREFSQLGNIAVGPQGDVYVTDRNAHRVYRITPEREVVPIAGNGTTSGGGDGQPALETGLSQVRGIWVLENGGYFVATQAGSQVWYVDTGGIIHLFLDGSPDDVHAGDGLPFDSPGAKISNARAVTMDRAGNLLVTENDLGFIRIVHRR